MLGFNGGGQRLPRSARAIPELLRVLHRHLAARAWPRPISTGTSYALDATRALAAGLVVLFHARIYTLDPAATTVSDGALYAVANCGTAAVFWFFVISGYLVGGAVMAEIVKTGSFGFRRYAISRLTRLYIVLLPALACGAVLDGIRSGTWGLHVHAGYETAASLSPVTLLGNVAFVQTLLVPTFGSNYALWSLSNEFWYYVLFPLLLSPLMINRTIWLRIALFLAGTAAVGLIGYRHPSMIWLFTIWCLGAAIRLCPVRLMRSQLLAWGIAGVGMLGFPILHPRVGMVATLLVGATFANAIMTTHGATGAPGRRMLALVEFFSGFSFSLYLIHLPLLHIMTTFLGRRADPFLYLPPRSLLAPICIACLVLASYCMAFVFSRVTERHTESVRRRLLAAGSLPSR
jgi:peptidoglycan/LPS O-acetylase OafA/YrhL